MTFRTRLTLFFLLAVLLPVAVLSILIRGEMTGRLTGQYRERVESLVSVIEEDLEQKDQSLRVTLNQICLDISEDNRFRRAAVDRDPAHRRYLLDYAGDVMNLAGLDMLQIQDRGGKIISSGHFRNEYDRMEPQLPGLLSRAGASPALVRARSPGSSFVAMARVDSLTMSGERFTVTGGFRIGESFLRRMARSGGMTVSLRYPGGAVPEEGVSEETAGDNRLIRYLAIEFADTGAEQLSGASFVVSHDLASLDQLLGSIDRWFLIVVVAATALAVILVRWLAARVSRPLEELAGKTSRLDLDNLDIDFSTDREDEIGKLSGVLNSMTARLRKSAAEIKDAERRATLGELARQVNHDIKNGLAPIRNIFRHLSQLAGTDSGELGRTFMERKNSLESSISYLEELATRYAGLTAGTRNERFDVNGVIRKSTGILEGIDSVELSVDLGEIAEIEGDPIALQRVMENLLKNARDALVSKPGKITVASSGTHGDDNRPAVSISVSDTGEGISEKEKTRIFDHFYSTRKDGTGLGLSIAKRLVTDLGGSLSVESEEGKGTTFTVILPLASER
ncbi:MAG: HAMP domain-containing sensor histidine kinase [Candidatus Krumholzibacteriales bacterium]